MCQAVACFDSVIKSLKMNVFSLPFFFFFLLNIYNFCQKHYVTMNLYPLSVILNLALNICITYIFALRNRIHYPLSDTIGADERRIQNFSI